MQNYEQVSGKFCWSLSLFIQLLIVDDCWSLSLSQITSFFSGLLVTFTFHLIIYFHFSYNYLFSGLLVTPVAGGGCELGYVAHSDPKGQVSGSLLTLASW